ncbi:3-methyladenine DNA glycosylase [Xylanimonas ulmi]|uniref:3-methyladenine DNA glycosylase n=1 Tax=Xylanimonas ulmi TaxID=228973 RepID=A0A4Q7M0C2_9MICO|nr:3-methyladenine DNA glycosylase [Xylanibacterium ulmi]RZS60177.1 hypothetical protein EV386_0423 [Xylanibacterium ulmi]
MPALVETALPATWREAAAAHAQRADALTAVWRAAHEAGRRHAIEDFLFTYYPTRLGVLRRWHPGVGAVLPVGADDERLRWRWHTAVPLAGPVAGAATESVTVTVGVTLDVAAFLAERGDTVRWLRSFLTATAERAGTFGCFGLHEWAMVYRDGATGRDHRHPLPLRLGAAGTDAVVEGHRIVCSHIDAFRFFAPEARSLNTLRPTRATQAALEQPGCLHATMDCYKWALKLGPAVPGDLLLDAFELARDVRYTDMQASPYDVSAYGLAPVAIETPAGKAEYVRRQRDFARRGQALRQRLLAVCEALLGATPTT